MYKSDVSNWPYPINLDKILHLLIELPEMLKGEIRVSQNDFICKGYTMKTDKNVL